MGPLFSAWKFRRDFGFLAAPDGFNGATSFQTWKCLPPPAVDSGWTPASMGPRLFRRGNLLRVSVSRSTAISFNGATSFQTWKSHSAGDRFKAARELQWGHVFSDVEISATQPTGSTANEASMGPRLFRRGNQEVQPLRPGSGICRLQWGHVFSDVEMTIGSPGTYTFYVLQWGHVFSDVEIKSTGGMKDVEIFLQWGHVFSDVEIE